MDKKSVFYSYCHRMDKEENITTIIYNKSFKVMNSHQLENNKEPVILLSAHCVLSTVLGPEAYLCLPLVYEETETKVS